ncbi:hypothetical protein BFJ70_g16897, partial [Fusarium oxysporum]
MPKRLLDVGQLGDPFIGLLEASDDARVSFAIGSYVWGNGLKEDAIKQAQTTKENIGYRMASGIEATGLPKSIQDLIEVTRQIGLRYLWLDAFCIVQDDNDDKVHQFNSLAEFYKQADILISAASASDCGEGFLQSRTVDRCYGSIFELPYEWKVDGHETRGSLLLSEMDLDGSTDNDPVHMRIWTFQEHLVSSRVISFGSRQIKWTCQQEKNSVDGGNYHEMIGGLEYNLRIAFSPSRYPYETLVEKGWRVMSWMEIVEEYSKRDYSRLEDRVPAFYEAMSLLAPHMGWTRDQCVYGIWKTDASRQLLWKKDKPLTTQEVEELKVSAKDGKLGPSWSWATLPGGVIYDIGSQLRQLGDTNPTIEFQKIDGQPPCLTIEGFVQEADWIGNYTIDVPAEDVQLFQVDLDVEMQPQPIIVQFILDLDSRGFPPRLRCVEEMANRLLADRETPPVSKRWASNFVKRHKDLKTHFFRKYDYQRAKCEDPTIIGNWFRLVANVIAKYGIRPDEIYNFDETGFMMGVIASGMVVTGAERRGRPKSVQPGNREWITVIQATNAEGQAIPPFIIGAGQYHLANWYRESSLPGDWAIATSPNGWTDNEIGLEWLKHFDRCTTKQSKNRHRLLILDGHESHHSVDFERYCKANKIITLCMPPHSSHLLQPLDVGCFGLLKKAEDL